MEKLPQVKIKKKNKSNRPWEEVKRRIPFLIRTPAYLAQVYFVLLQIDPE